jgi:hypothetical protein
LTKSQKDRLDALLKALQESRERVRGSVGDLLPQLHELLQHSDASSEALATVLRGGLKTVDTEVDAVAARASEFLRSLDGAQRDRLGDMLRLRLR